MALLHHDKGVFAAYTGARSGITQDKGGTTMETTLSRYWWVLALRGLVAILFGLAAFFWPGMTLAALVLLLGAYALADGIFAVSAGIRTYTLRCGC